MDIQEDVKGRVRKYIVDNIMMASDDNLADEASLLQLGILDSTGVLELITFIEDSFGIKVEEQEMLPENLDSLKGIAAYVARKGGKAVLE